MLKIHNSYFEEAYAIKKKFNTYSKFWEEQFKKYEPRPISEEELESKQKVMFALACVKQALITRAKKWRRTVRRCNRLVIDEY